MPIKIDISISSGGRFKPLSSRTFGEALVTVGRDEDCTLTLEDVQKHVSRVHAELAEENGVYWMKVVSKVNPVIVNGKRYMFGNRVALADGDTVAIGLYRLEMQPQPPATAAATNADELTVVARPGMIPPPAPAKVEETTFVPPPKAAPPKPAAPPAPPPQEEATYIPEISTKALEAKAVPRPAPQDEEEATYIPDIPPKAPEPTAASRLAPPEGEEATYIPDIPLKPGLDATNPVGSTRSSDVADAMDIELDLDFDLSEVPDAPGEAALEEATFVRPADPLPAPKPTTPAAPSASAAPPVRMPAAAFRDETEVDGADEATMIRRPEAKPPAAAPTPPPTPAAPPVRMPAAAFRDEAEVDGADEMTMIRRPDAKAPAAPPPPSPPAASPVRMPAAAFRDEAEVDGADEMTMIRRPDAKVPAAPQRPPAADVDPTEEMTLVRPTAPVRAALPAGSGGDAAARAFLEGAGLAHLDIADAESFMRNSGMMVRAAVEGLMMLLLAREEARRELGAGAPEPEANDNPLKSMANPAEVIAFLFDPQRPAIGDADPVQAFGEACADVRAHQVALLASIRSAAMVALASFDPKKIERDHGTSLGGLNLTRKSKLWDISLAQHEQLAQAAMTDFNGAFGREILAAYTAQVKKVRGR